MRVQAIAHMLLRLQGPPICQAAQPALVMSLNFALFNAYAHRPQMVCLLQCPALPPRRASPRLEEHVGVTLFLLSQGPDSERQPIWLLALPVAPVRGLCGQLVSQRTLPRSSGSNASSPVFLIVGFVNTLSDKSDSFFGEPDHCPACTQRARSGLGLTVVNRFTTKLSLILGDFGRRLPTTVSSP